MMHKLPLQSYTRHTESGFLRPTTIVLHPIYRGTPVGMRRIKGHRDVAPDEKYAAHRSVRWIF